LECNGQGLVADDGVDAALDAAIAGEGGKAAADDQPQQDRLERGEGNRDDREPVHDLAYEVPGGVVGDDQQRGDDAHEPVHGRERDQHFQGSRAIRSYGAPDAGGHSTAFGRTPENLGLLCPNPPTAGAGRRVRRSLPITRSLHSAGGSQPRVPHVAWMGCFGVWSPRRPGHSMDLQCPTLSGMPSAHAGQVLPNSKVALVTGSSRGIGAAIAVRLAADGLNVLVNYRADREAAQRVVAAISAGGGRALAVQADVADAGALRGLFDAAEEHFGRVDVVVSSAGIGHTALIADATDADFDAVFATNTRATFVALREAARRLLAGGRVIVISRAKLPPRPGGGLYAASKAAGDQLVRAAAQELGPRQITVNSVLPGATRTDMWTSGRGGGTDDEAVIARTALRRIGEPDDIASVVAFLASDAARWITGETIAVDGGLI
jgi:3-oxoacyl-[acyl-carrier protein] reductase